MKHLLAVITLLLTGLFASGQSIGDFKFGTDTTFEVMTWNLQGFPKNGQVSVDYVKQIIESLDVDLVALQEVDDVSAFEQMVAGMDSFAGHAEQSSYALAYIYKKGKITINDIYEIFTASSYWRPFPRNPLVMDLKYMGERVLVIDNHLKCCGDGFLDMSDPDDDENRRYNASILLKDYIETYFAGQNAIVVGDLNDELTDVPANNVFQPFLDDSENYRFADMAIATGPSSDWSYPTWPSHIDHLLITNELFDEEENAGSAVQTIRAEEFLLGGWSEYEANVTDHRPVAMKLKMNLNLGIAGHHLPDPEFINSPNPFSSQTIFTFKLPADDAVIEIVNVYCQKVFTEKLPSGRSSLTWNPGGLPEGLYFARLLLRGVCLASRPIVLKY
jgi:endonuclease/exonuclease/phosphatase family metal-dependent hydrolase